MKTFTKSPLPRLLLAVAIAAGTIFLIQPPKAEANCNCSSTVRQTLLKTGMGETCAEATNDLISQLNGLVNCANGVCEGPNDIFGACYPGGAGGAWVKRDGRYSYQCNICF
jgi:hypothetical protein